MSDVSSSSRDLVSNQVDHRAGWRVTDGLIAICTVVLLPIALGAIIVFNARLGILPKSVGLFIFGDGPVETLVQYMVGLAVEAGVLAWFLYRRQVSLQQIGWRWSRWRWFMMAFVLYCLQIILAAVVVAFIKALWPQINLNEVQDVTPFGNQHWAIWASFAASVLIAPIIEETLFRGLLFSSLRTKLPIWAAALIAAAIFGLLHGQINAMIYTFIFGLLLTWLYVRSRSLLPGVLLHTLNNMIAFWLLLHS